MPLVNLTKRLAIVGAGGLALMSLTSCGGGSAKAVDAEDWVSDFCDAAKDYQSASDDLGNDFIDVDFAKKGAKSDIVKVLGKLQKEQDTFKKAAAKAGTPDLDSGKEIRKAVDDEFKARSDDLKKTIDVIKKLDEGRRFENGVQDALSDLGNGEFRSKLEKLASKRATKDAQDVIDLIDKDAQCSSVAFAN